MFFPILRMFIICFWPIMHDFTRTSKYVQSTCKTRVLHVQKSVPVQGAWISVQGAWIPVQKPVQNTYFS